MTENLRDLLRQRAAESGGAPPGLTEGALAKARSLGRRRFAAGAVGAVAGVAVAGMALAALIAPDEGAYTPPTEETATPAPTTEPPPPDESTGAAAANCDDGGMRPSEWDDRGFSWPDLDRSDAPAPPETIPDRLYFYVSEMHHPRTELLEGDAAEAIDGGEHDPAHRLAPNGARALVSAPESDGKRCEWSYLDLTDPDAEPVAAFTADPSCPPSWSPDANRVVIAEPATVQDPESYVFDLTTGERTPLPEGVGCSPVWTPDGRHLVGEGAAVRPDGSGRIELEGLAAWSDAPGVLGLESVSSDLSRACLFVHETDTEGKEFDLCGKYIDTATGAELELPVEAESHHVVFLTDGSMLLTGMSGADATLYLVGPAGAIVDQRPLPWTGPLVEWLRLVGRPAE